MTYDVRIASPASALGVVRGNVPAHLVDQPAAKGRQENTSRGPEPVARFFVALSQGGRSRETADVLTSPTRGSSDSRAEAPANHLARWSLR